MDLQVESFILNIQKKCPFCIFRQKLLTPFDSVSNNYYNIQSVYLYNGDKTVLKKLVLNFLKWKLNTYLLYLFYLHNNV